VNKSLVVVVVAYPNAARFFDFAIELVQILHQFHAARYFLRSQHSLHLLRLWN
jgi:hypothetical protein